MKFRLFRFPTGFALLVLAVHLSPMYAEKAGAPDHWVATWATAAVPVSSAEMKPYVTKDFFPGSADMTLRQVVHTSLGGRLLRVELTNALGTEPLTLGPMQIALADSKGDPTKSAVSLSSTRALTFNGSSASFTIPAGGEAVSDPVAVALPAETDLIITMLVPAQQISTITWHEDSYQSVFYAPGNLVNQPVLPSPQVTSHWYFLKSVDVQTPANTGTVVAFGDSITSGYASTPNTNQRWPDDLARRLQANKPTSNLGVINEGISGNRLLRDGFGLSGLVRFDREVIAQPGVRYVILLEGINDIGASFDPQKSTHDVVTAADIELGLSQLAERAHAHNIKVFGATLTPYMGARYSTHAGEQLREAVNTWIRSATVFDGVVDFDKATRSATTPQVLAPAYDHGDHLHPSDAGMKAMADSIDLKLLTAKK